MTVGISQKDVIIIKEELGKTRLFSWHIAPLLHHRLLHLPGVGLGPGTHLLGHIHTLFIRFQLGHKLGDMGTGSLGLKRTFLLGGILDNSLGLVITGLSTLLESTASRGTQLPRLLGASSDGGVLLHRFLGSH